MAFALSLLALIGLGWLAVVVLMVRRLGRRGWWLLLSAPLVAVAWIAATYGAGRLAALAMGGASNGSHPIPTQVDWSIRILGAGPTVGILYGEGKSGWGYVTDRIGEGDPEWLRVAANLAPGTDAEPAEELGDSLGLALPMNPRGVLAAIDAKNGPAGVDTVCSVPLGGNNLVSPLPRDYPQRSIAAVLSVQDPTLKTVRDRCLAVLRGGVCLDCGG
jgi:hypothetical protein